MKQLRIKDIRFATIGLLAVVFLAGCGSSPANNGKNSNNAFSRGEATLDIVNQTDSTIYYLYLSDCSSGTWGEDQLGTDVIVRGESYSYRMTPGCWDLRAESADGEEVERFGVDLDDGDTNSWTINAWPNSRSGKK